MLAREMAKTRVHQALTRKLIYAIRYLSPSIRSDAVKSLVNNFLLLYPVFPNVMILIKTLLPDLDEETKLYIYDKTRDLLRSGSHITQVPVNLAYAVRVLAEDRSEETEELLARIYRETDRIIIKRDIILIMAKRNADYWVSDVRKTFNTMNAWEKRSLIIGSFILEDEGIHWRNKIRKELSLVDELVLNWASDKFKLPGWSIPI